MAIRKTIMVVKSHYTGEKSMVDMFKSVLENQILTNYALEQGFSIFDYYIDDGISGKDFNRPAFQKLIEDIKDRKINCLITREDYVIIGLNQKAPKTGDS